MFLGDLTYTVLNASHWPPLSALFSLIPHSAGLRVVFTWRMRGVAESGADTAEAPILDIVTWG
jgi:hypothetical protein